MCCRLLTPLLPLVFCPLIVVRRAMATVLTYLVFGESASEPAGGQPQKQTEQKCEDGTLCLAACFMRNFSFPCKVQAVACTEPSAAQDAGTTAQVRHAACLKAGSQCCITLLYQSANLQPARVVTAVAVSAVCMTKTAHSMSICNCVT